LECVHTKSFGEPFLVFFCNQFMDRAGAGDAYISVTRILMEGGCLKRT
jgi:hypothetical protein